MIRHLLLFTALLGAFFLMAQDGQIPSRPTNLNTKFSVSQLQQDFQLLRKALEEAHPGLYWHTDKKTFDDYFELVYAQIDSKMTEGEFFQLLAPLVARINCVHTEIRPSSSYMRSVKKNGVYFPFKLKFNNDKAFVINSINPALPPATEILYIGNIPISRIIHELLNIISTDGRTYTARYHFLDWYFKYYYPIFFKLTPHNNHFKLRCRMPGSSKTRGVVIPALNYEEMRKAFAESKKSPLSLNILKEINTAVLTIKRFWFRKSELDYEEFLASAFKKIAASRVKNLIIDLRSNDGGEDPYGSLLFSYLTDKPFRYYEYIEVATKKITFLEHTNMSAKAYNVFLKGIYTTETGKYRWKKHQNLGLQKPVKNNFKGNVYILINSGSLSVTSEFCAVAHYYKRAIFIGTETGGGYYGNTSGETIRLILPNTKLRVDIPLMRFVMAIPGNSYKARGIIPDYIVAPTVQDIINKVDREMNFALDLIKKEETMRPSESGNNMPFQRHRCPGPDFSAEKGKKGIFSRHFLLKIAFLPFSAF